MSTPYERLDVLRKFPQKQGSSPGVANQLTECYDKVNSDGRGILVKSKGAIGRTATLADWSAQNKDKYQVLYIAPTSKQICEFLTFCKRLGTRFRGQTQTAETAAKFGLRIPMSSGNVLVVLDNADCIPGDHAQRILKQCRPAWKIIATCISNSGGARVCADQLQIVDITNRLIIDRAAEELSASTRRANVTDFFLPLAEFLKECEKTKSGGISFYEQ